MYVSKKEKSKKVKSLTILAYDLPKKKKKKRNIRRIHIGSNIPGARVHTKYSDPQ